ncbi:MAG TPA: hypothetical protein VMW56_06415 [Candidatus Margulisiibacteriota bacterium]|nr:hypothetical protein [Candidatus Margulisiibacteriota bacterium]
MTQSPPQGMLVHGPDGVGVTVGLGVGVAHCVPQPPGQFPGQ